MGQQGLYLHVPFCSAKCGYCDFFSVVDTGPGLGALVERMLVELDARTARASESVATIFIGGGTPTVLCPKLLTVLLNPLAKIAADAHCREFTVEANPETLDDEKAAILAEAGVDRLSLGAQSFHPAELALLERIHTPQGTTGAVKVARRAGIGRINLDLIFGIPGQTLATWADSLDQAMDLGVDHLAIYGLTYETGTPLTRRLVSETIRRCDDGLEADMYGLAVERLAARGFEQYEISSFALPGQRCLHNLIYWNDEPYIGVGPSAAGYIDGERYRNAPDIAGYSRMIDRGGEAVIERERLTGRRLAAETAMLRLRLVEGIDLARFEELTGFDPRRVFAGSIERFKAGGLVRATATHVALTDQGRLVADPIIADFMAELDLVPEPSTAHSTRHPAR